MTRRDPFILIRLARVTLCENLRSLNGLAHIGTKYEQFSSGMTCKLYYWFKIGFNIGISDIGIS
jgi:hypothetical protein